MKNRVLVIFIVSVLLAGSFCFSSDVQAQSREEAIEKWVEIFQPSAISKEEQRKELEWFAEAAESLQGVSIKSVAEGITTHEYEANVLAEAFEEITGISVVHDIIGEGELVDRVQRQIQSGTRLYDIYVNDADLIGTHIRLDSALNLTEYMAGEGKDVTNPYLDLDDFMNLEFGQDYEGNQLQLPDQQFATLYWFRYDWFTDPEIKKEFKDEYGYELGVPLNWAAYEDIAEFFTGKEIDGVKVYGHMDYGKRSPSLGWRFTDAWLSIAGAGDKGLPNGFPVDEWGIRVNEEGVPVGASVKRGGAANGPAAYYALEKYIEWMKKYAPPFALSMTWSEAGPVPSRGNIAQQIFKYITWLSPDEFTAPSSPVTDATGKPLWRVAPIPHGRYWEEGMKVGYQDAGSWTILKNTVKGDKRKAAWLWAQFCVSKTVSLCKFNEGYTPVRNSTVNSDYWDEHEGELGGIVTFYRSPEKSLYTDSGPNVPHYPLLAEQWWKYISRAVTEDLTPKEAMDQLAEKMDDLMGKMRLPKLSPQLNEPESREYWLNQPGAPKPEKPAEEPATISYEELIKQWK